MAATPFHRIKSPSVTKLDQSLQEFYIGEAIKVKGNIEYVKLRNLNCVKTSFLLYLSFCATEEFNSAFLYLHESITLAQILGLENEKNYKGLSKEEDLDHRMMYWGLFVSERGFAIHETRPVVLHDSIELPHLSENDKTMYKEFATLARVMKAMDDDFISLWNADPSNNTPKSYIMKVMSNVYSKLLSSLSVSSVDVETGIQRSNIFITQPWLQLLIWNQVYNHSSNSSKSLVIRSHTPVRVAAFVLKVSTSVNHQDLLSHGPGMRKKFYDIGITLADFVLEESHMLNSTLAKDSAQLLKRVLETSLSLSNACLSQYQQLEAKSHLPYRN